MKRNTKKNETLIILHNIRSVYNVGSVFRTADAVGVTKIYLSGYTPAPLDRFGRVRKDVAKVALGAEKNIPWEHIPNIKLLIKKLKKEKTAVVAIEQSPRSKDYKKFAVKKASAFIFGNEVGGIEKNILKQCDHVLEIPMRGKLARNRLQNDVGKESLNVSVSAGVVLFRILNI